MKTAKLKYACKIAGVLIEKGTTIEVLDPMDDRVQAVWSGIEKRMGSTAVCVQLPHLDFPTLFHMDQLEL